MRFKKNFATLHHAGSAEDNPVLEDVALRLKLSKNGSDETLRKCWIQVGQAIFKDLTLIAVSTDDEITVDLVAGTDLSASSPPVKNVVHFTTSRHRHVSTDVWVATRPPVMITLDGYNASNPDEPLIYPFYRDS